MILTPYFQGTTLSFLYGKEDGVCITKGYRPEGMGLMALENCITNALGLCGVHSSLVNTSPSFF